MSKLIDIIGNRYGRLTVIGKGDSSSSGAGWICLCECGNTITTNTLKLRRGHTKSCGCLKHDTRSNLIHGHANRTRTYKTWKEMRQRCNNPNNDKWKWYGSLGITVAKEWDSFSVFLQDMGERPEKMTLDRINPFLGYSKENCRWATAKEQANNTRKKYANISKTE